MTRNTVIIQDDALALELLREKQRLERENERLKVFLGRIRPRTPEQIIRQAVSDRIEIVCHDLMPWQRSVEKADLTRHIKRQLWVYTASEFREEHIDPALDRIYPQTRRRLHHDDIHLARGFGNSEDKRTHPARIHQTRQAQSS